jgi:DNA-binding CsgD family transcriptional regulator
MSGNLSLLPIGEVLLSEAGGTAVIAILFAHGAHGVRANVGTLRDLFSLTELEAEVACLIADGLSPAEVAQRLDIGLDTLQIGG